MKRNLKKLSLHDEISLDYYHNILDEVLWELPSEMWFYVGSEIKDVLYEEVFIRIALPIDSQIRNERKKILT